MSIEFNEGYVKDLASLEERCKSNSHRLDDVEANIETLKEENKALYTMNTNIEKMCMSLDFQAKKTEEIANEVKTVKADVTTLKDAPNKAKASIYDKAIAAILGAVGSGLLIYLLGQAFPQIFGA